MALLREVGPHLHVRVKAMPGSGGKGVSGCRSEELLVRLQARAEKGKANRELLDVLGRALGVPRSSLSIVSGESARHKVVAVPAAARARIEKLAAEEA